MLKLSNEIEDLIIPIEVFSKLLVCFFIAMLDVTISIGSYLRLNAFSGTFSEPR